MVGPSGAVAPGAREPFGPVGGSTPWGDFTESDLFRCYPRPRQVAERLQLYPQRPVGNSLRDPLPVPFTAAEVVAALNALPKGKRFPDRACARIDPTHVHVALAVLPILESRNGGWIDFVAGRREDPYLNVGTQQRANVFNLRCLLHKLPGKPLPGSPVTVGPHHDPRYAPGEAGFTTWPCNLAQPSRLGALYNIADVRTTFVAAAPAVPVPYPGLPGPRPIGPGPDGPGSDAPYGWPPPGEFVGLQLEDDLAPPEPFAFSLFELFQSNDIKGA